GIDAAGVTLDPTKFTVIFPELTRTFADNTAATAARAAVNAIEAGVAGGTGDEVVLSKLVLQNATQAQVTTLRVSYPDVKASPAAGNLYGSSKDVGTIVGKLPTLTENGGRVNRVGFTRLELEGTMENFGFFYDFSKDSLDFDSDSELKSHLSRELINGAVQLTEAALQIDLLFAAGTVIYAGEATSDETMTGETGSTESVVTYEDLMRLDRILNENRTPRQTKIIS